MMISTVLGQDRSTRTSNTLGSLATRAAASSASRRTMGVPCSMAAALSTASVEIALTPTTSTDRTPSTEVNMTR